MQSPTDHHFSDTNRPCEISDCFYRPHSSALSFSLSGCGFGDVNKCNGSSQWLIEVSDGIVSKNAQRYCTREPDHRFGYPSLNAILPSSYPPVQMARVLLYSSSSLVRTFSSHSNISCNFRLLLRNFSVHDSLSPHGYYHLRALPIGRKWVPVWLFQKTLIVFHPFLCRL